jgi:hypothetical protein
MIKHFVREVDAGIGSEDEWSTVDGGVDELCRPATVDRYALRVIGDAFSAPSG